MKAATCIATLVLAALSLSFNSAFALVHVWSQKYGGVNSQGFGAVAADASGNLYVGGSFYGTVNFGGGNRTSNGGSDIALVKFTSAGAYVWDRTFGDVADAQYATGVGVDASGNVFFSGVFEGSVNFGGGLLTSAGDRDIFVAKFSPTGTYTWAKRFGTTAEEECQDMVVDITNGVCIAGYTAGSINFGGGVLTNQGSYDAYLARFDGTGAHQWSKRFGDASAQYGAAVTTDHWGNIFFGMTFAGSVDMGAGSVPSAGSFDIGVAQYGSAGGYQWSHSYGDASQQQVNAMAAEEFEGYVYVTGSNFGTVDFGGGPIASAGSGDVFLAKLDCFGGHLWSKGWGDAGDQFGNAVRVDPFNNVYLAGAFDGAINFGGGTLTTAGNQDIFLARLTFNGDHVTSARFGDASKYQIPGGLASDSAGNLTMCGGFPGTVDFGGGPLTATDTDAFLVQFAESPTDVRRPLIHTEALWAAPNPFNPLTVVHFNITHNANVRLDIFDVRGARVATLVDREMHPGTFTSTWGGTDDHGQPVSSGVYYARLSAGATPVSTKLVLLK
ncbi:MAG TPA: FlgD immunoglobulin-like domain containing protein [Candidatus Krumholzibacteria bacterium]|nr:FlgD immunoglobulin-like domain containing protein [Candidatus Krumholzibacteria bacterium]